MALEEVLQLVGEDMAHVDELIRKNFESDVAMVPLVGNYLFSGGGKRLRPLLVLMSSRLCGYGGPRQVVHSCVVEFLHTATLLHDDVVDGAHKRRGRPSANVQWGNQAVVLVGDFLFARAFDLMARDGDVRVMQLISETSLLMAEGEILQLIHVCDLKLTEEEYLDVIYRKTAALISTSCRLGGLLGNVDDSRLQALERFGKDLGLAFQLVDDILDLTADEEKLGKPRGTDLKDGNVTLPLVYLYHAATQQEKAEIEAIVEDEGAGATEIGRIVELMEKYRVFDVVFDKAGKLANTAKSSLLSFFEDSPYRRGLLEITDFVISRKF